MPDNYLGTNWYLTRVYYCNMIHNMKRILKYITLALIILTPVILIIIAMLLLTGYSEPTIENLPPIMGTN